MTHIPLEAGGFLTFVPEALANTPNPPQFRISVGTRRDRELLQYRLQEENYQHFGLEDIRAEIIVGLKAGWSEDDFNHYEPLIKDYWNASEDHEKEFKDTPVNERPPFIFEAFTAKDLADLATKIADFHKPLRTMTAQNNAASRGRPVILLSVMIAGWSNLEVPFAREGGKISVETAWAIKDALSELEESAGVDEALRGTAFMDLFVACSNRLFIPKESEKNLPLPSTSAPTPALTEIGAASPSGTSKDAAPLPLTLENSSKTQTTASSPSLTNATEE